MVFKIPQFPTTLAIWHQPNLPPVLPDVVVQCQLTPGRRAITPAYPRPAGAVIPGVEQVLLPRGTDIRDGKATTGMDRVECPVGSGRFYDAVFVDDIGFGFPNEHRFAQLRGLPVWPVPFPFSRFPPGITATVIGFGSSLGIPVVNIPFPLVMPFDGVLFLVVADYNSFFPSCGFNDGSGTFFPAVTAPISAALGQTGFACVFVKALVAGHYNCVLKTIAGADVFQYQALCVTGITTGVVDNSALVVGAGAPLAPGPGGQTNPVDLMLSAFAQIGSVGPFGYGLGFINTGFDVTDVVGGIPCTLSAGTLTTTAIGLYPSIIPLALDAGFSGFNAGFY